MNYTIDTLVLSGSFPLQRAIPGSESICDQQQADTPQAVDTDKVGAMTLDFQDCSNALLMRGSKKAHQNLA